MLKSFKSYIRESSDDEAQVLRDLLSGGLISRSEFYTLAKESRIPLRSGDFEWRYTVTLGVRMRHSVIAGPGLQLEEADTKAIADLVEELVSTVDSTVVSYIEYGGVESDPSFALSQSRRTARPRYKFILTIASDLAEEDLDTAIQQALYGHEDIASILVSEIELH